MYIAVCGTILGYNYTTTTPEKVEAYTGSNPSYTDVLSLAPVSCGFDAPIVLVKSDVTKISNTPGLQEYLNKYVPKDLSDNRYSTYVAGNINYSLYEKLPRSASGGKSSDIDHDKYLSNLVINKTFTNIIDTSTFIVANGQNFPDALGGAALAGKLQAPILFTGTDMRKTYTFNIPYSGGIMADEETASEAERVLIYPYIERQVQEKVSISSEVPQ